MADEPMKVSSPLYPKARRNARPRVNLHTAHHPLLPFFMPVKHRVVAMFRCIHSYNLG